MIPGFGWLLVIPVLLGIIGHQQDKKGVQYKSMWASNAEDFRESGSSINNSDPDRAHGPGDESYAMRKVKKAIALYGAGPWPDDCIQAEKLLTSEERRKLRGGNNVLG